MRNAKTDPRTANHEYVRLGEWGFYAGSPLVEQDVAIGALCVLDRLPRRMDDDEKNTMYPRLSQPNQSRVYDDLEEVLF